MIAKETWASEFDMMTMDNAILNREKIYPHETMSVMVPLSCTFGLFHRLLVKFAGVPLSVYSVTTLPLYCLGWSYSSTSACHIWTSTGLYYSPPYSKVGRESTLPRSSIVRFTETPHNGRAVWTSRVRVNGVVRKRSAHRLFICVEKGVAHV